MDPVMKPLVPPAALASLAALSLALAACGGGGTSVPTGITGTVSGLTLTVADAGFTAAQGDCGSASVKGSVLRVRLASTQGQCAAAQGGGAIKNTTALDILLEHIGGAQPAAFGTGTYTISPNPVRQSDNSVISATAKLDKTDASCHSTVSSASSSSGIDATSGTVTIAMLTSSAATGSFSLVFPNGGKLSGEFATSSCAVPIAKVCTAAAPTTCQ